VRCGEPHSLRFARGAPGDALKPYVLVRGRLEALVSRALLYDLAELAVEEECDGVVVPGVWSGGTFFAMALS
jgi:uncharacterized protein